MTIRITVFPARCDVMLVCVEKHTVGPIALPPIPIPFSKEGVAMACGLAGVDASVRESVPGEWTEAMAKAKKDERSARFQKIKLQQATDAMILKGSNDPAVRDRAEALRRKLIVDERIRELKVMIDGDGATADQLRRWKTHLASLQTESLALQTTIGKLRDEEKKKNHQEQQTFERRFIDAARKALDKDLYAQLIADAQLGCDDEQEHDHD